MNAVLENPELRAQALPMALETYHMLGELGMIEEKTELIDGIVLPKMPKSPRHFIITKRLLALLNSRLPADCSLRKEEPLSLIKSEPEPDLAIVRGQDEDYARTHPLTAELVVEVSLSSMARDLVKLEIYAAARVREYWIVNADAGWVDIYTKPTSQGYAIMRRFVSGETVVSTVVLGLEAEVDALFA